MKNFFTAIFFLLLLTPFIACSKKNPAPATSNSPAPVDLLTKMPALEEETKDRLEDKMIDLIKYLLKPEAARVNENLLRDSWDD